MKAILVDDEPRALKALENKLARLCPDVQIIGKADSTEQAYQLITELRPDLLFLDVAMPKESGFDLLKRLPDLNFEIIFVTGFDDYAIDAFKFSAVGYIVKPIESGDLINAVQHAKEQIDLKEENERNKQLLRNISHPANKDNRIGIPTLEGFEFVAVKNILHCEGLQRCTKIVLSGKKSLVSSYNLGEFIKLLTPYNFFSPHRSHLINLDHVARYDREGTITMEDGTHIPVSRRKKLEFLEQLVHL